MYERIIVKKLNAHLYLLDDAHEATGYLLIGQEKALLIDTMNGIENVKAVCETLTDKPVAAINTHGHCDHIFGNVFFDKVMICAEDLPLAANHSAMAHFVKHCEEQGLRMPPFETVKDGDVLDLGGLHLDVLALPGHTRGSICLLLREDRILFTGDGINRHLWNQLEESQPLAQTLAGLDRIAFVRERADRILHGHAQGFEDIVLFDKLREGVRQLVEQEATVVSDKDAEYTWFGGKCLQHEFDRDSVIVYGREKL